MAKRRKKEGHVDAAAEAEPKPRQPSTLPAAFARRRDAGGFDCVLGNPPWERVKLQEREWFAERVPEIANAPNAAARTRLIDGLKSSDPGLHERFLTDVRAAEAASAFLRGSGRYPLCGRGDVNLYTVFTESMRDSLSPTGRVGCIVPSGIATDDTTKFFFQDLVERASLASLFDFENALPLFEGVHRSYKFSCLTLRAPAPDPDAAAGAPAAEFVFFAHTTDDLAEHHRRFTLTPAEIALVNPNTRTCPIFRSKVDAELTKYIYRRVPVLIDETKPDGNPWGVEFSTMFHMSNDSGLFRTREQLEKDGWELRGNVFERGEERYLPLYEAKMVHHFDHRWATYEGEETRETTDTERADASRVSLPRYWIPAADVRGKLRDHERRGWAIAYRWITNTTNERTFVVAATPEAAFGNSAPLVQLAHDVSGHPSHWFAVGASFVFDYSARQKLGGVNMTFGTTLQLPFVNPSQIEAWHSKYVQSTWVARRSLELSATADDMAPFSKDLWPEGDGAVFRYDPARRFEIRCELDAAFFHLYLGTTDEWRANASPELLKALPTPRDAVAYIMDTFPIVRRKDEEAHGEYRTKNRILALYDQLADALRTGRPFTSSLTPPPGPPTNPDGTFAKLPAWPKGKERPKGWPEHIHPPVSHRQESP